jgi:hypothetical protein
VGSSGLIFVVIVAAWALFLVPSWLQRRAAAVDPVALAAEVDEEERAALGLDQAPASRVGARVLVRARSTDGEAETTRWASLAGRARAALPRRRATPTGGRSTAQPAVRSAAARRRRILLTLTAATVLVALGTAVAAAFAPGVVSWAWTAVPGGLLVGYLALLAITRPGARSLAQPSEPMAPMPAAPRASVAATQAPAGLAADGSGPTPADDATLEATFEAELAGLRAGSAPAAGTATDTGEADGTWTPTPVRLPSYVTAPPAPRRIRTIDLSAPGSWASADEPSVPDEPAAEPAHRRAVGD